MKVALVSMEPKCGKTSFAQIFAGIFSRSQMGRYAAILTTGDVQAYLDNISTKVDKLINPYALDGILNSNPEDPNDILAYGIRQGQENVYIFNTNFGTREKESEKLLLRLLNTINVDLTLLEIQGDPREEKNKNLISKCDVTIYLCTTDRQSFKDFRTYYDSLTNVERSRTCVLVSKHDESILSDRSVEGYVGLKRSYILNFPYSPLVAKYSIQQNIDSIPYLIYSQDVNWIKFRSKMLECMELVFDDDKNRVIRGLDKWHR